MDTLTIIFISLAIIFLPLFFIKWRPRKTSKDTDGRQVSIDTEAEVGTDKLLRHLDERENADYNAELMAKRTLNSTVYSDPAKPHVLPHEKRSPERNLS